MRPPIQDTLRELVRLAKAAGATEAWLTTTGDALVQLVLELEALRHVADPRKVATLIQARKVAEANAALVAADIPAGRRMTVLKSRFDLSKSRINALILLACNTQANSVLDSADEPSQSL